METIFAVSNVDGGITAQVVLSGKYAITVVASNQTGKELDRFFFNAESDAIHTAEAVVLD